MSNLGALGLESISSLVSKNLQLHPFSIWTVARYETNDASNFLVHAVWVIIFNNFVLKKGKMLFFSPDFQCLLYFCKKIYKPIGFWYFLISCIIVQDYLSPSKLFWRKNNASMNFWGAMMLKIISVLLYCPYMENGALEIDSFGDAPFANSRVVRRCL